VPTVKPLSERNPVLVGATGIALLAAFMFVAFQFDDLPLVGGDTTYRAAFRDASGLAPDNEVRMAGVRVGEVTEVRLANGAAGPYVRVSFRVDGDVRLGRDSEAHIKIKTMLGQKYLGIESVGSGRLDEGAEIPVDKTTSPFALTQALKGLATEVGQIDTAQLAAAFEVLATTFADTPANVGESLAGLAKISQSMAERDNELRELFTHARKVTDVLVARDEELRALVNDAELLMAELSRRRDAIHQLVVTTDKLAVQLSGLVADNRRRLGPALDSLRKVLGTLQAHREGLDRLLTSSAQFVTRFANASGTGRWVDAYIHGFLG
jgi:phospholipid/cholesterol/gamma-HCH transport system substrate-binding protein